MSNNFGRKSEYTPAVYTRYFERTETAENRSNPNHLHFDDEPSTSTTSSSYQNKRDLIFKRLFPSKYADATNDDATNANSGP